MTTMYLQLTLFFLLISTHNVSSTLINLSSSASSTNNAWCIANRKAADEKLQANIDWICSLEGGFRDCTPINPGGQCYEPNTMRDHASFVMNLYFQNLGRTKDQCDFRGTGTIVYTDPSHGSCVYVSY
ncbi:unnamed protein product [Cochlearia groenlandica]